MTHSKRRGPSWVVLHAPHDHLPGIAGPIGQHLLLPVQMAHLPVDPAGQADPSQEDDQEEGVDGKIDRG